MHGILRIRAEGEGEQLEALAVVQFEQFRHQYGRGVVVEVRRVIAHAYPAAVGTRRERAQQRGFRVVRRHEIARGLQLQRRLIAQHGDGERRNARLPLPYRLPEPVDAGADVVPVADGGLGAQDVGQQARLPGVAAPGLLELLQRFFMALGIPKQRTHELARLRLVRLEPYGLVQVRECLRMLLALQARIAAVHERIGILRLQRQGLVEAGDGLQQVPGLQQRIAPVVVRLRQSRLQRQHPIHAVHGRAVRLALQVQATQVELRLHVAGLDAQDLGIAVHRRLLPAHAFEHGGPVVVRQRQPGRQGDRPFESGQRLGLAPQAQQRIAAVEMRIQVIGLQRDGTVVGLDGVGDPIGLQPGVALRIARLCVAWQCRLWRLHGGHTKRYASGREARGRHRGALETDVEVRLFGVCHGARMLGIGEKASRANGMDTGSRADGQAAEGAV